MFLIQHKRTGNVMNSPCHILYETSQEEADVFDFCSSKEGLEEEVEEGGRRDRSLNCRFKNPCYP